MSSELHGINDKLDIHDILIGYSGTVADFVRTGGARAIIAELADGLAALRGEAGTTITKEQA